MFKYMIVLRESLRYSEILLKVALNTIKPKPVLRDDLCIVKLA
jgi:hypothetical protein